MVHVTEEGYYFIKETCFSEWVAMLFKGGKLSIDGREVPTPVFGWDNNRVSLPDEIEVVSVTNCGDCPMYGEYMVGDDLDHACYHPSNPESWNNPFRFCPLKEKAITVKWQFQDTNTPIIKY